MKYVMRDIKTFTQNPLYLIFGALVVGVFLGYLFFGASETPLQDMHEHGAAADEASLWTCSMHPQVKLDKAGQCPICFMDLITLAGNESDNGPRSITLSHTAMQLARVSATPVRKGVAKSELRLSGKIDYDETRISTISAWFPGRLERLFVDYTGINIQKGDHLFEIYSPALFSAQEELLRASERNMQNGNLQGLEMRAYDVAREKVRLLGLSSDQIDEIIERGTATATLQVNSPITGVVTKKQALQGKYVKTGDAIYTIADLSKVWLLLDAFEKDLPWLSYGQEIAFRVTGQPGRSFTARVAYIDPLVNQQTRSITVRAVLDNSDGSLKPGMLVEASIDATLDGSGQIVQEDLAGKYSCPMHPEVLEDHPEDCPICGMDLVPLRVTGTPSGTASEGLLIPASAVFQTGDRALVYVETAMNDAARFELREIVLGPRVHDEYLVLDGLEVGELVVTNGNFKIDSAMQIAGKQSAMAPMAFKKSSVAADIKAHLAQLRSAYLLLQSDLANDDQNGAGRRFMALQRGVLELGQRPDLPSVVKDRLDALPEQLLKAQSAPLPELRVYFEALSKVFIDLEREVGHEDDNILYEVYCPMAFDNQGASWLQRDREIKNPYFGASMLSCGEIRQQHTPLRSGDE